MAKRPKFYLVISKDKGYLHGAFEATEEGEKKAKKYMKEMEKKKKVKLYLKIK